MDRRSALKVFGSLAALIPAVGLFGRIQPTLHRQDDGRLMYRGWEVVIKSPNLGYDPLGQYSTVGVKKVQLKPLRIKGAWARTTMWFNEKTAFNNLHLYGILDELIERAAPLKDGVSPPEVSFGLKIAP